VILGHVRGRLSTWTAVVTDTARSHAESWAAMFNEYLANREETQRAFTEEDYLRYLDGKPCYDGVRSFLHSRGIDLPEGTSDDPPGLETVCGLGNRKNDRFLRALEDGGADAYPSTCEWSGSCIDRESPWL
jgi:beta-phosphoglucomutase-like phosphatase (HAD superfamily)